MISHITPSTSDLLTLESVHPESIQWPMRQKTKFCNENPLSFWEYNNAQVVGEFLVQKKCDNYAELISISSLLPGTGTKMWEYLIPMLRRNEIDFATGHARLGASWHLAEKFGAEPLFPLYNWGGTGEVYMYFKLKI